MRGYSNKAGALSRAVTILTALLLLAGKEPPEMKYVVKKIRKAPPINASWDKEPWTGIEPLLLASFMGERPRHFPKIEAKLAYDDNAVYVIFRVEDKYVLAKAEQHQGAVYRDSCVEVFFAPGADSEKGYFNLEMNCGGTMFFAFQPKPRANRLISLKHIGQVEVAHSLPRIVMPEIDKETTWVVEYRLPISILENYRDVAKPGPGVNWRANFYKCADGSSQPHWITWTPVTWSRPEFHLPEFFGVLAFE